MPFLRTSRYAHSELVETTTETGRAVSAVKLRRLPAPPSAPYTVDADDRVDLIAYQQFGDAPRFWHVADANSDLDARTLIEPGRVIAAPENP